MMSKKRKNVFKTDDEHDTKMKKEAEYEQLFKSKRVNSPSVETELKKFKLPTTNMIARWYSAGTSNETDNCNLMIAGKPQLLQRSEQEFEAGGHLRINPESSLTSRYTIIRKLGVGGYATVWKAKDNNSGTYVAAKIAKCSESAEISSKLELKTLQVMETVRKQLPSHPGHKHLLHFLEAFPVKGAFGIHNVVIYNLLGPTLNMILNHSNQKVFHLENVRKISKQLLHGLDFLHNQCGIIHGDIKTANIMIRVNDHNMMKSSLNTSPEDLTILSNIDFSNPNSNINVVIGDFGLSCPIKYIHKNFQTCFNRAPEVILKARVGSPLDMWSFGCILYELVTSTILFRCINSNNVTHDVEHLIMMSENVGIIDLKYFEEPEAMTEHFSNDGRFLEPVYKQLCSFYVVGINRGMSTTEAYEFSSCIDSLLVYDPLRRMKVEDTLKHPFLVPERIKIVPLNTSTVPEDCYVPGSTPFPSTTKKRMNVDDYINKAYTV